MKCNCIGIGNLTEKKISIQRQCLRHKEQEDGRRKNEIVPRNNMEFE